jgi:endo-1,4-beta-xylanase
MKRNWKYVAACVLGVAFLGACSPQEAESGSLKSALNGKFYIGAALNTGQITGHDTAGLRVLKEQFNSIVAENCMKVMEIHPEADRYDFELPDQFVALGESNGMFIIGHNLLWHSQLAPWFCVDEKGKLVDVETLKARIKSHISTIVGRYKGRVNGWDVVNEAILDNGDWRESPFYQIMGEEFMDWAFQCAHEADPEAELYYNDYNEWYPGKREAIVRLIKRFQEKGIRIDAIGMQGHIGMDYPGLDEYEASILAFANAGVKVMITELDLTILPSPNAQTGAAVEWNEAYRAELNPYPNGLPADKAAEWNQRMGDVFALFLKHHDKITRVTMWGIADNDSWRNGWPIPGRTDYPLLFDREHQAKPVVKTIIDQASKL